MELIVACPIDHSLAKPIMVLLVREMSLQTIKYVGDECWTRTCKQQKFNRENLVRTLRVGHARLPTSGLGSDMGIEVLVHHSRTNSPGHLFLAYNNRPFDRRSRPFKALCH